MKRLVILPLAIQLLMFVGCSGIRPLYERELKNAVNQISRVETTPVTSDDLKTLTPNIRKYIEKSGVVGKDQMKCMYLRYHGQMQTATNKPWMKIECEQFNSTDLSLRLWYGKIAFLPFIPIEGRHIYSNGYVNMLIKMGPITLVDLKGPEANQSDMITWFNDMIFMPSALLSSNIGWKDTESNSSIMFMTNSGMSAKAELFFDSEGYMTNFITQERYRLDGTHVVLSQWETWAKNHQNIKGVVIPAECQAVWKLADGYHPYFIIDDAGLQIEYNHLPNLK